MIKYLADPCTRLTKLKQGMEANPTVWQNQPETPAKVQIKIDLLTVKEKELEDLKELMVTRQAEAHTLSNESEEYADRLESITIGLEGNSVEKLNPYGITLRKTPEKRSAPANVLHPTIVDDTDGIGFIVTTTVDGVADNYEWQKGISTDATKMDLIPEMKFFKMTAKASFVDDDVPKGVRVFYRVRAINRAGQSPWSEVVSRVQ
jgi:hypothetical protein